MRDKELASKINKYLLNHPLIKEYIEYEQVIKKDEDLMKLRQDIQRYQKLMMKAKNNQEGEYESLNWVYEDLRKKFESNPLVNNYLNLKEEVNNLLQEINQVINQEIDS